MKYLQNNPAAQSTSRKIQVTNQASSINPKSLH